MHKEESTTGIVVAGFMDLVLDGIISVEKKKITVIKDLPDRLERIVSLYEYLSEKLRSINKLMSNYTISTGGRMK